MSKCGKALSLVAAVLAGAGLLACGGSSSQTETGSADFSLSLSPTTLSLNAGSSSSVQLSAASLNSFSGQIAVALSGLPSGVTATPASLTLTLGTPQTVSLVAAQTAASATATVLFSATSGTLSHSAQLALTVVPAPPGFTLSPNPASLTLTPGGAGVSSSIVATGTGGFSSTVAVSLTGLPSGVSATPSTLSLVPGTAQQITFTAAASAAAATSSIAVNGASGSLSSSATISITVGATTNHDITTYHDDVQRTGQNLNETTLTLSNVNSTSFGKLMLLATGGVVDAQPLYLENLTVAGAMHNVLFIASENDSVYAFDADTGAQLWTTSVLESGETPSDDCNCTQITPQIGITSTPVIDRTEGADGTIFVVGMSKDSSGNYHHRLHALDITTGAEETGSPVEVQATYPGTGAGSSGGTVPFTPSQYAERAALLLLNGTIYTSWTSHCDDGPYTGWLIAYNEQSLQQTAVLNLTPNGSEGAIWMSGDGPAADSSGNIYFLDANGTFDTTLNSSGFPSQNDFGNAFLKISTANGGLAVADYFGLDNTVSESASDVDLGSGGELLLPDLTDSSGTVHQLAVGAGKDGNIYVVDRNNLGKFSANTNGAIYQELTGVLPSGEYAMPAYFNNTVYYGGVSAAIQAFPITNAQLAAAPAYVTSNTFVYPGATPSISANGSANGILWAVENESSAVLYAYNAANLQELYDSTQAASGRDSFGAGNKFMAPLIANGKVYVGTPTGVAVFGLLP